MKNDDISVVLKQDRFAAGAQPFLIRFKQWSRAALAHLLTIGVQVWPGHLLGPAYHRSVGALDAAAAKAEGNEKIVVLFVAHNERRFDGLVIRRKVRHNSVEVLRSEATRQRIELRIIR